MGDGELIDRLRRREQSGLEELSRRYGPLMRYILSPILPDEQDREECLADVVLLVWERVDAYSPDRGAFSTWLTALTRNAAISRARKRRQDTEPLSPEPPGRRSRSCAGSCWRTCGGPCRPCPGGTRSCFTENTTICSLPLRSPPKWA